MLYFVDTYANYHDTQLAEALVAVMEHNGVAVYVAPGQTQSGMAMISVGVVDRARAVAQETKATMTFFLSGMDIAHRLIAWFDELDIVWERAMVTLLSSSG